MTNTSKLTIAFAAAAFSIGAALSFASPASAASSMLEKCQPRSSRAIVEGCCNTWIRKHGRPLWMMEANTSCSASVVCVAKKNPVAAVAFIAAKPKCQIVIEDTNNQGSDNSVWAGAKPTTNFKP
jgi:hypothetical protein